MEVDSTVFAIFFPPKHPEGLFAWSFGQFCGFSLKREPPSQVLTFGFVVFFEGQGAEELPRNGFVPINRRLGGIRSKWPLVLSLVICGYLPQLA